MEMKAINICNKTFAAPQMSCYKLCETFLHKFCIFCIESLLDHLVRIL